jgi:uncharacterized protein HemX
MTEPSPSIGRTSVAPWLVLALVVVLGIGGFIWMDRRIDAVQGATVTRQDTGAGTNDQAAQAVASLQDSIQKLQSDQKKLGDELTDIQRKIAAEGGERKLLSDQLGALSARLDSLASANAESTPTTTPQAQKNRRARH